MDRCLPVGVRFHPTDEELIGHYLYLKNNPNLASVAPSLFLPEFDLYGESEPWIIWEAYGGPNLKQQDLFFFTLHKKKANPRGGHATRHSRRVGSSGTWSQGEPSKLVFGEKNQEIPIGRKTKLRYENKLVPEQHGCWIMEEYSTVDDSSSSSAHDDYVICRLRRNNTNRSSSYGQRGAIRNNNDNKRKPQDDDDDHHPKHRKKPKSLTVADPQPAFTTSEARKTVSLKMNQSPNPEQQFDTVEMLYDELFGNDDDHMVPHDQEYETQHLLLEGSTDDHIDYALEVVEGDTLPLALSEQHTCSSLTVQPSPTEEDTYTVPHIGSDLHQPRDQNELITYEAQSSTSIGIGMSEDTDWLDLALEEVLSSIQLMG
ncbi:NAC domain-containing protein 101-like [Rosa rugosa]|uniref:NAC domain-containing protein 101-like n=1 Tax=Rosa rugosa TaxID=74645 RepID=UPI002B40EC6E|nr:NAC domain-containing protein 101-like [Rosa rugosa]